MAGGLSRSPARGLAWALLVVAVTLVHGVVGRELAQQRARWGDAATAPPPRIEVAFVRELAPAAPLPVQPRAQPPRRRAAPPPAMPAASAPPPAAADATEPTPLPEAAVVAAATPTVAPTPETTPDAVDAWAASAASAAASPIAPLPDATSTGDAASAVAGAASAPSAAFEWPPSTQLSYTLTGHWRGDLVGEAQVQWLRAGSRYQVHLDVDVNKIVSRRMSSDGELTDAGLAPRRYDEHTQILLQEPRRATLHFGPDRIVDAFGRERDAWAGVQDTASQFVQLTWLFTTQPERLRVGQTLELPLALPRRSKRLLLDVVAEEALDTPMGTLATFHLRPRPDERPNNDVVAEIWFAPALQYLPVRIRLQQRDVVADLMLRSAPLQAAR